MGGRGTPPRRLVYSLGGRDTPPGSAPASAKLSSNQRAWLLQRTRREPPGSQHGGAATGEICAARQVAAFADDAAPAAVAPHLLNNEPNNEAPVHCKRLIVNNEGKWAHCCNNEPPWPHNEAHCCNNEAHCCNNEPPCLLLATSLSRSVGRMADVVWEGGAHNEAHCCTTMTPPFYY